MNESDVPLGIKVAFEPEKIASLKESLRTAGLPRGSPIQVSYPWDLGIDYAYLKLLIEKFENDWTWEALEKKINKFDNYLVHYDEAGYSLDLHFLHAKSQREDAIPLLMMHGWPGTFFDFYKVFEPLINPPQGQPAFHVVAPSLPGYFLSTHPQREGWTIVDTARLMHWLMVRVLGYERYAGQAGDWGSYILRIIGNMYPNEAPVLHFNMFRCPTVTGIQSSSYTDAENKLLARRDDFGKTGKGYLDIQSTKPLTIGLAIASSPLATLIYIGEKMYAWSDPRYLDPQDILDTVALYYLSGSFATSVLIYHQSNQVRSELTTDEEKWRVTSKIGYTAFPYEIGGAPRAHISAVGPLVFYKEQNRGGHFPALDAPLELVEDLRDFLGAHWKEA